MNEAMKEHSTSNIQRSTPKAAQQRRPTVPQTRPPLRRMAEIRRLLVRGELFNASTLAKEFEVSAKTIHRDIDFMREALGYEITWVAERCSFAGRPGVITTI